MVFSRWPNETTQHIKRTNIIYTISAVGSARLCGNIAKFIITFFLYENNIGFTVNKFFYNKIVYWTFHFK